MTPLISAYKTFRRKSDYLVWSDCHFERVRALDAFFSMAQTVSGYCDCCGGIVELRIPSGATFGSAPNLREGFLCPAGLNARSRLLYRLLKSVARKRASTDVALFEDFTRLKYAVEAVEGVVLCPSMFLSSCVASGDPIEYKGERAIHQDMTSTSYEERSFDVVMHGDVLEHIPDYRRAIADNFRILRPGGVLIASAPFFPLVDRTKILATQDSSGGIVHHIEDPEYHGDPVAGSILAFYRFSWDLLTEVESVGFCNSGIVVEVDPFSGLLTNNCPGEGNMVSLAIVAVKK